MSTVITNSLLQKLRLIHYTNKTSIQLCHTISQLQSRHLQDIASDVRAMRGVLPFVQAIQACPLRPENHQNGICSTDMYITPENTL